ncbi:hypothetical protein [Streptomyces venezuelae]
MTDTQITFARVRLGGHPEDVQLRTAPGGAHVVYIGSALTLHIPATCHPDVIAALAEALTLAAQQRHTSVKAVA